MLKSAGWQEALQWVHGGSVAVRRKLVSAAVDDCQLQAWWCPETALALLIHGCNAEEGMSLASDSHALQAY